MSTARPTLVGSYDLLQDFVTDEISVRVFRLADADAVRPHLHHRSAQVYIALVGEVAIDHDGPSVTLRPFEAFEVRPGVVHGARAVSSDAVLMNVSAPPLESDDQLPAEEAVYKVARPGGAQRLK